ncbi:MAG: hypothetical protein U0931_28010 [Vulcanimicrobiota bacterium]
MKIAPLLCLTLSLTNLVGSEPAASKPAPVKPMNLPVIEIHDSTPVNPPASPAPTTGPIELTPIQGQKAEKMTATGRAFWGGPYGMPAGPGRAWPGAAPPGTPGAPAGGLMSPAGVPSRF